MPYEQELQAALDAAAAAGEQLVRLYAEFQKIADAPADITTEADHQAQEIVLSRLHQQFPQDAFCAEEATPTMTRVACGGRRLWVIDPIDGTRGFARKNGEFSVMVAFVEDGVVGAGVVLEPARQRVTYARRGGGCWRRDGGGEPVRCRVTATADLGQMTLTQSRSRSGGGPTRPVELLQPARVLETYSAGIKMALVARGEADVYANTYDAFHDWDIAAGYVLVEEAGGKSTGLRGEELRFGEPGAWQRAGLLSSNGVLHEAAVARLR